MHPQATFEEVVRVAGGLAVLAAALGETAQTVSNWRGRGIPANRCKAVESLTGVSVRKLRPDDWADYWPDDGAHDEPAKAAA